MAARAQVDLDVAVALIPQKQWRDILNRLDRIDGMVSELLVKSGATFEIVDQNVVDDDGKDDETDVRQEAFVELLSPEVGYNLRHFGPRSNHMTGVECPCWPQKIWHSGRISDRVRISVTINGEVWTWSYGWSKWFLEPNDGTCMSAKEMDSLIKKSQQE